MKNIFNIVSLSVHPELSSVVQEKVKDRLTIPSAMHVAESNRNRYLRPTCAHGRCSAHLNVFVFFSSPSPTSADVCI
jgi:hypothetical protein